MPPGLFTFFLSFYPSGLGVGPIFPIPVSFFIPPPCGHEISAQRPKKMHTFSSFPFPSTNLLLKTANPPLQFAAFPHPQPPSFSLLFMPQLFMALSLFLPPPFLFPAINPDQSGFLGWGAVLSNLPSLFLEKSGSIKKYFFSRRDHTTRYASLWSSYSFFRAVYFFL